MEYTYKLTPFEGYTHSHTVEITNTETDTSNILHIYSDTADRELITEVINERLSPQSFRFVHTNTKAQDEHQSAMIQKWLNTTN